MASIPSTIKQTKEKLLATSVAAVLVASGGLKGVAVASESFGFGLDLLVDTGWVLLVYIELVLAILLVSYSRTRVVWRAVFIFFTGASAVAGWKAFTGVSSCGCFGDKIA